VVTVGSHPFEVEPNGGPRSRPWGTMAPVLGNEDLADVVSRERRLLDPSVRRLRDSVAALLHPDFVEYGASGRVWGRAEIIDAMAADPEVSGEATDFAPVEIAESVILLTYRIVGASQSLRSSVWVAQSSGNWRLRFHQGTPLLCPA
jgi:hypothetical protein